MKTLLHIFVMLAFIHFLCPELIAQSKKETLTVLNIDTDGVDFTPQQMGNLVRIEVDKLKLFEVMDKYDVAYMIDKHNLNIENCYGKIGLVEVGRTLNSDKMLSGSIERFGETLIITMRLVDVAGETTERTQVQEYLNLPKELQTMLQITLKRMFDMEVDEGIEQKLTKRNSFEAAANNPDKSRLNLSGPRMGFTCYTGETAGFFKKPKNEGGYDAFPVMFQFGYQFELQYLNEGNFQALFEFIPTITGLDQSIVIPSLTLLNGMRESIHGWEFAIGPTFNFYKQAEGYFDTDNNWHLKSDWPYDSSNPFDIQKKADSRGDIIALKTGFVVAFGKSFKSGHLNIPFNVYVIPNKEGLRFGASFGYNARKKKNAM